MYLVWSLHNQNSGKNTLQNQQGIMRRYLTLIFFLLIAFSAASQDDSLRNTLKDSVVIIKDSVYRGRLERGAVKANQKLREKYLEQADEKSKRKYY